MTQELVYRNDLREESLSEVFGVLYHYQVPAVVRCVSDTYESSIYVREGAVVSAESNHYEEQLERTVLLLRKVPPNQVKEFFRAGSRSWLRQGHGLIEKGFVAPEEIDYLFNFLAKSILYSVLRRNEGEVEVTVGPFDDSELIHVRQPLADLVMDGVRSFLPETKLKDLLLGSSTLFRLSPTAKGKLRGFYLSPGERMVLRLVDGHRSLRDLCALSPYHDYDTCRLLAGLLILRVLEIVPDGG